MQEQIFDPVADERSELDRLIDKGIELPVPTRGIERLIYGKRERMFEFTEPCLGALDLLAVEMADMRLNDNSIHADPIGQSNAEISKSAKRFARVVAIAYLNDRCRVKLPGRKSYPNHRLIRRYTEYFFLRLKPSVLVKMALIIRQLMNAGAFINSIRWTSGAIPKAANPKANLIEEKP